MENFKRAHINVAHPVKHRCHSATLINVTVEFFYSHKIVQPTSFKYIILFSHERDIKQPGDVPPNQYGRFNAENHRSVKTHLKQTRMTFKVFHGNRQTGASMENGGKNDDDVKLNYFYRISLNKEEYGVDARITSLEDMRVKR